MVKIKQFKKDRRTRQLLLLFVRALQWLGFMLACGCVLKAMIYPVREVILSAMVLGIAAGVCIVMLQGIERGLEKVENTELRRLDARRRHGRAA